MYYHPGQTAIASVQRSWTGTRSLRFRCNDAAQYGLRVWVLVHIRIAVLTLLRGQLPDVASIAPLT